MGTLLVRFVPHLGSAALLVIAALCAALALTRDTLADVRKDLRIEQALHQTDIATFKAAQARAKADHLAEIDRLRTENRRQTDEADRRAVAARSDYAARVLRLPAAPGDPGLSRAADMPDAGVPQSPDRSGGDTILLTRADALICAANTARLEAAHEWAIALARRTNRKALSTAPQ